MREFNYKDQNKKVAYRGILPHNDVNCCPFDYFKDGYALFLANEFRERLKIKDITLYSDDLINKVTIQNVDKKFSEMLGNSTRTQIFWNYFLMKNFLTKNRKGF